MNTAFASQPITTVADLQATTPLRISACPFCAEDIHESAIRCKHCRSDLVKTCPACKEQIHVRAVKCNRCGDNLNRPLPFAAIPGSTPTSGIAFFFIALLIVVLSLAVGPIGPGLVVLSTSIWAAFDAKTHRLAQYDQGIGSPAFACIGSLLLWIVVFPWYLAIRSRIRAGIQPVRA
jgi:Double zinc ribbon